MFVLVILATVVSTRGRGTSRTDLGYTDLVALSELVSSRTTDAAVAKATTHTARHEVVDARTTDARISALVQLLEFERAE
jgi:hypothetical protein